MRKFLIALVSALIAFSIVLSGCGCSGSRLEFSPLFYGTSGEPNEGYIQQATYSVVLNDAYGDDIKKNAGLDNYITYDYSGTYVSKLSVTSRLDSSIKTDMREEIEKSDTLIYKLETTLTINLTYTIKGGSEKNETDTVKTITYFTPANSGFIPIYTSTKSNMHYIAVYSDGVKVQEVTASNSVLYNNKNYVVTTKYDNNASSVTTYDYKRQTLIDNSQLLFVIRNIELASKEQYEMPTVSYQYGAEKNIMITNDGVGTTEMAVKQGITINGEDYNKDTINVKRYKFRVSEDKNMGVEQFVYIQNGACGNLGNRSVMYRYVEPIYDLGSYACLGVLEYTLTDLTIVE